MKNAVASCYVLGRQEEARKEHVQRDGCQTFYLALCSLLCRPVICPRDVFFVLSPFHFGWLFSSLI